MHRLSFIPTMASFALIALAANTDQGAEAFDPGKTDISAPEGGQIALTAHNNQDGTWAITRGPGGDVLEDDLQRDEALAIVGAPASPLDPDNAQEVELVERRKQIEARAAELTNAAAFEPDAPDAPRAHQIGGPDTFSPSADNPDNGRAGNGDLEKANAENDDLRKLLTSRDEDIRLAREENEALKAQVAKFDPDGDGKTGGKTKAAAKPADDAAKA